MGLGCAPARNAHYCFFSEELFCASASFPEEMRLIYSVFLTMEALGRIHPIHRNYEQWYQMSESERRLHLVDMAETYIMTAEKYHHDAIFVHPNPDPIGEIPTDFESTVAILKTIRELSGDKYFLMIHGDPTFPIPDGDTMMEFSAMMYDEPEKVHEEARKRTDFAKKLCDEVSKYPGLVDGFCLCSVYCFNVNPYYSRSLFAEFVQPYLKEALDYYLFCTPNYLNLVIQKFWCYT